MDTVAEEISEIEVPLKVECRNAENRKDSILLNPPVCNNR